MDCGRSPRLGRATGSGRTTSRLAALRSRAARRRDFRGAVDRIADVRDRAAGVGLGRQAISVVVGVTGQDGPSADLMDVRGQAIGNVVKQRRVDLRAATAERLADRS